MEKVLNLASLEKNRINLSLKEIDLNLTLAGVIEQFKQTDFGQKAEIQFNNNQTSTIILADKFHFSHLILNILENAVKYCEQTPNIKIVITEKQGKLELNFYDNGIGIQKDHRKKVFKKFYRIPTGNVHNVKGFGLGLDYVKKIVDAHKWRIKINENTNGGSIFTILISTKK